MHSRQLHSGMPDLSQGLKPLNHNSLDRGVCIPACQIYFRFERHSAVSVMCLPCQVYIHLKLRSICVHPARCIYNLLYSFNIKNTVYHITQTYRNPPNSLDRYVLDDSPLNASEQRIASSFSRDTVFPRTVHDAVNKLQSLENISDQARGNRVP